MKVIVIGGVAGGASCAARLRRLDEKAEILMVERSPFISYANCGLPYFIGGVIEKESSLLVATEQYFKNRLAINVRTNCEAIEILPKERIVKLRDLGTDQVSTHQYDKLVLSPGAVSVHPPLKGINLPGVFHVRTIPDARAIREWIQHVNAKGTKSKQAVVVGGGFIGLEMVENLVHQGFEVTIVEMLDQILPQIEVEHARVIEAYLRKKGVNLALSDGIAGFKQVEGGRINVETKSGKAYSADIVILALGVKPDTSLARTAGIKVGEFGGIRVDEQMRTSNPDIFAVGDAVEVRDFVTGKWALLPLAGPANRQGRIVADVITGRNSRFRGTQGTTIIGLFGVTIAFTGVNEKTLKKMKETDYEKIYIYPNSHAGYYPGAKPLAIRVIFRKSDGRIIGALAYGEDGVDKRIDVFAAMIQMGATVYDLEEAELCYAPQYGSAKDSVNFAGMVAANILRGDSPVNQWDLAKTGFLLDVREPAELEVEKIPGVLNVPLGQLRSRLNELPRDKEIEVFCRSGQRSYYATRILLQNGFKVKNVSGGMLSHSPNYQSRDILPKK